MSRHTQKAKGYSVNPRTVKIAVSLPRENFEYMKRKALAKGWTISEVIREYIATGIYVDQDMGEDYPAPVCTVDISRAPGLRAALENRDSMTDGVQCLYGVETAKPHHLNDAINRRSANDAAQ